MNSVESIDSIEFIEFFCKKDYVFEPDSSCMRDHRSTAVSEDTGNRNC